MTNDELMALPDVTPTITEMRFEDGDGEGGFIAFPGPIEGVFGPLFQRDDDGVFQDADGRDWMTGWHNGVRVRRLFNGGGL